MVKRMSSNPDPRIWRRINNSKLEQTWREASSFRFKHIGYVLHMTIMSVRSILRALIRSIIYIHNQQTALQTSLCIYSLNSHQQVSAAIAAIFRPNSGRNMLMGIEWIKYVINVGMHFVSYLQITVTRRYLSCIRRAVYLKTVFIQLPLAQLRHTHIS